MPEIVHATAIAVAGRAVIMRGPAGSGKSDLALRCIAMPPNPLLTAPVQLVADDQVEIERTGARLIARPPASIRGLIEVRGVGVVAVPYVDEAEVALVADLVRPEDVERLPEPGLLCMIAGVDLPYLKLAPFEPSAPLKLLLSLALYKC